MRQIVYTIFITNYHAVSFMAKERIGKISKSLKSIMTTILE